jgi:sucrose-6-phosphate hydrolase SacC (GH32 family)
MITLNHDIKVYRLTSSDGVNWTPNPTTAVLEKSAGKFDSRSTETPAVVYFAGKYHMFWTGYTDENDTATFRIGHATSTDGVNFTKDATALLAPTNPGGAPNLDFNQFSVAEPAPIIFNNKLHLYFGAIGANAGVGTILQVVGLTTTTDGTTWTTPVSALVPDQTLYPRGAPDYNYGYSTPHAIVMDNKVHLYFDVAVTDAGGTAYNQQKIHHAYSSDGLTSWVHDTSEIFSKEDFSWTANEIRSPAVYLNGKNLMLWYAGHQGITLGIGLANCGL